MVRFARADGSKSSNKRVMEEATPWSEMVSQMKRRKELNPESVEEIGNEREQDKAKVNSELSLENSVSSKSENEKELGSDESPPEDKSKVSKKKTKKKPANTAPEDKSKVSKKKTKKKPANTEDTNYVIEDGKKFHVAKDGKKRPWFVMPYEENDRMTRYEGFWVKRKMVKKLNDLKETFNETTDADSAKKKMMKAKRKAHKDLIRELIYEQKDAAAEGTTDDPQSTSQNKKKNLGKDEQTDNKDEDKLERVLFNGYWVTKEGADRLKKLRGTLAKKGVSKEEIKKVMKSERRKEEKALRRETKRVCLRCRRRGHLVGECPEIEDGYKQMKFCVCYKCGSTEHKVNSCPQADKGEFSYATCYICKKVGHISRQCPDNPRGLYPHGGSCRGCGSVDHLVANCPVIQAKQDKTTIKVGRIDGNAVESLDAEEVDYTPVEDPFKFRKQKPKTVKFD